MVLRHSRYIETEENQHKTLLFLKKAGLTSQKCLKITPSCIASFSAAAEQNKKWGVDIPFLSTLHFPLAPNLPFIRCSFVKSLRQEE